MWLLLGIFFSYYYQKLFLPKYETKTGLKLPRPLPLQYSDFFSAVKIENFQLKFFLYIFSTH